MMAWFLSFLPRSWLRGAMVEQWTRSLTRGDRIRFYHWGATGNPKHHPFQWADELKEPDDEDRANR